MLRENNPIKELTRIFAAMGETADKVAECLRAHGCRGSRGGGLLCPVFRYVYRKFDEGQLVLVHSPAMMPSGLYLYSALDGRRSEMPLPAAIAEFLARFDAGSFPDLDLDLNRGVA
jgi:hypothetical protein